MSGKKVLLAYSGGIDSQYAAKQLLAQKYVVEGVMFNMAGDNDAIFNAQESAKSIGINLNIVDVQEAFKHEVIDYFTSHYLAGKTPSPCIICNYKIKWQCLHQIAMEKGFECIATGHYFNIAQSDGIYHVAKAADKNKDQSYFLWMLPQHILKMALTPMATTIKNNVLNSGADSKTLKESMGVCFLANRDYRDFIKEKCSEEIVQGQIIDNKGKVVGSHQGVPFYTIGQKRGLEIEGNLSVIAIDSSTNRLIVGSDDKLWQSNLILENWLAPNIDWLLSSNNVTVKVRGFGRNPEGCGAVSLVNNELHIKLSNPAWAAAVGQPVVLYVDNIIVGGGFLKQSF